MKDFLTLGFFFSETIFATGFTNISGFACCKVVHAREAAANADARPAEDEADPVHRIDESGAIVLAAIGQM